MRLAAGGYSTPGAREGTKARSHKGTEKSDVLRIVVRWMNRLLGVTFPQCGGEHCSRSAAKVEIAE